MISSNIVEAVIQSKITAKEQFTAYDITLELRKNHSAFHNDVKVIVHDFFSRGLMTIDYKRTMVTLVTGQDCYLYHPVNSDPNSYSLVNKTGAAIPVSPSVITIPTDSSSTDSSSPTDSSDSAADPVTSINSAVISNSFINLAGVMHNLNASLSNKNKRNSSVSRVVDKRSFLSVPVIEVKKLNLKPGETCCVANENDNIVLFRPDFPNKDNYQFSTYKVDKCNQVRICKKYNKGKTFNFIFQNDMIVASPV